MKTNIKYIGSSQRLTKKNEAKKTKASSPLYLGEEIASVIPNIQYTNLGRRLQGDALANEKKVYLKGIYADAHFFDFLSFQLTSGNEKTALKDPFPGSGK